MRTPPTFDDGQKQPRPAPPPMGLRRRALSVARSRALAWSAATCLAATTLAWSNPSLAQGSGSSACSTGGITVELLAIGNDDTITGTESRNPNRAECENGAALSFQLTGLPDEQNLVLYVGDEGSNCQDENVRDNPDNAVDDCNGIGTETLSNEARVEVDIALGPLLCTSGEQKVSRIYFFPEAGSDVTDTPTAYGCYDLTVDADPPAAPTDLNDPQGENILTLSWEPVGDSSIQRYIAFYDDRADPSADADADAGGGASNSECPSSIIVEGAELDRSNLPSGVGSRSVTGQVASSVDISTSGIGADVLPVAVAAEDQAGNVGPLSEVVCMRIVETTGFWDEYQAAGGDAQGGCACAVEGRGDWTAAAGATAPVGLVLLGLGWRARRRRT